MENKIRKSKKQERAVRSAIPYKLKLILPLVFGMQGATKLSPVDLYQLMIKLFKKESYNKLEPEQLSKLREYLNKHSIEDFTKEG